MPDGIRDISRGYPHTAGAIRYRRSGSHESKPPDHRAGIRKIGPCLQIPLGCRQQPDSHLSRSRRRCFASSQSTKCALPSRTAARRLANTSPCQSGEGTSSGRRHKSAQSRSINTSFSGTVMPSSGMSDALLMSQILWPGHHPSNYGLDAAKPRARYGVWPRAPSRPAAGGGRSSRGFTTTEPAAKFIRTTWARKRKEVEDPGGVRAAPSRTRCRAWCGLRTGAHEPGSQAARRGGASYAGSSCSAHPPSDWMEKRGDASAGTPTPVSRFRDPGVMSVAGTGFEPVTSRL